MCIEEEPDAEQIAQNQRPNLEQGALQSTNITNKLENGVVRALNIIIVWVCRDDLGYLILRGRLLENYLLSWADEQLLDPWAERVVPEFVVQSDHVLA